MIDETVRAALARAARFGPFFRLSEAAEGSYGWRPAPSHPADAIDDTNQKLDGGGRRVAASTFFLGYAARLLSPAIGTILLDGVLPDLRAGHVSWRPDPLEFGIRDASGWTGSPGHLVDRLCVTAIDEHLIPFADAVRREASLSDQILRGNIASAAMGALTVLSTSGVDTGDTAERLLRSKSLSGTGTLTGKGFLRNSCCLYYRVPGGGLCGDCILTARA